MGLKTLRAKEIAVPLNNSPGFRVRVIQFVISSVLVPIMSLYISITQHRAGTGKCVDEGCLPWYPMVVVFTRNVLIPVVTTAFLWFKVFV